jgi:hypothetical protein
MSVTSTREAHFHTKTTYTVVGTGDAIPVFDGADGLSALAAHERGETLLNDRAFELAVHAIAGGRGIPLCDSSCDDDDDGWDDGDDGRVDWSEIH